MEKLPVGKIGWLLIALNFSACDNPKISTKEEKVVLPAPKIDLPAFMKDQILLTNDIYYTGERSMYGASAFLLRFKDSVYAVTAKHLLGEGGGIEPEIKPTELSASLISWKMYPRVQVDSLHDTVVVGVKGLDFSSLRNDILILKVLNKGYKTKVLIPDFGLPETGERLFIVGCPYSQQDCRQNTYEVFFVEYDYQTAGLVFEIKVDFELPGFSGAPVINERGEVVAVLTSGVELDGKKYVIATGISQINMVID